MILLKLRKCGVDKSCIFRYDPRTLLRRMSLIPTRVIVVLIGVCALAIAIFDFVEVVSGQVDPSQHLPFFWPVILVGCAVAMWWVEKRFPDSTRRSNSD